MSSNIRYKYLFVGLMGVYVALEAFLLDLIIIRVIPTGGFSLFPYNIIGIALVCVVLAYITATIIQEKFHSHKKQVIAVLVTLFVTSITAFGMVMLTSYIITQQLQSILG